MSEPLRILLLEDNPTDAELITATLESEGLTCECHRVVTREQFSAHLNHPYDLILSDYSLPGFGGIDAQQIALERRPDLPFVFVSGTMGEEVAIERLKAGATDYVLKHRLGRLTGAVRRALAEAQNRKERDRARAEVSRLNAELEQRVADRTNQLAQANTELARREWELRKATAFLDSIVENLPAVVFVKDARYRRYVRFNRAGEELIGKRSEEVIGHTDHEIFPAAIADAFARTDLDALQGRGPVNGTDEVLATEAKGVRVLHTKKIPILGAQGTPEYLLGIAVDITERQHAEEAVRLARLEAERANQAKSKFLSRMSHDLRTPLNAILGFAQLLESEASQSPEQLDNVRQILKGGEHLLVLINEVLDIARIETGHVSLSIEPLDVSGILQEVLELMRPLAAARQISLTIDDDPHGWCVRADPQRLRQIFVNLVGNAVKYNSQGGDVRISGGRSNGRIRIRVSDTGPGIPPGKVSRLFQPFERLGAELGTIEGKGIGLTVAKGLVEAMEGAIGVESPASGATFWIELPAADDPAGRTSARRPADSASLHGAGTVLYVEDNAANVRLVERLLSRRPGVRLAVAGEGEGGIMAAIREQPDLILLDLHLPDSSGEEVLQRLLSDPRTARIPVAVLSADATQAHSDRLLRAGAKAYLTKPLVLATLLELIDTHLGAPGAARPSTQASHQQA